VIEAAPKAKIRGVYTLTVRKMISFFGRAGNILERNRQSLERVMEES